MAKPAREEEEERAREEKEEERARGHVTRVLGGRRCGGMGFCAVAKAGNYPLTSR